MRHKSSRLTITAVVAATLSLAVPLSPVFALELPEDPSCVPIPDDPDPGIMGPGYYVPSPGGDFCMSILGCGPDRGPDYRVDVVRLPLRPIDCQDIIDLIDD
jgi:hypothetical protein